MYKAMNEYGIKHFHIELIEETNRPSEQEIYWIKQLNTQVPFGYNVTLGGGGKKYIDHDLVVDTYLKCKSVQQVALQMKICEDSIYQILHNNNIQLPSAQELNLEKYGKPGEMYDLHDIFLQSFPSTNAAAKYMVDNNLTKCKLTTIKQHIREVCVNRRKTAAKFKWKYANCSNKTIK